MTGELEFTAADGAFLRNSLRPRSVPTRQPDDYIGISLRALHRFRRPCADHKQARPEPLFGDAIIFFLKAVGVVVGGLVTGLVAVPVLFVGAAIVLCCLRSALSR
jgi:hypothetical protein